MSRPYLLLQLRPEREAADDEYRAVLRFSHLDTDELVRIHMDQGLPDIDLNNFSAVIVGGGPSNISYPVDKKYDYQKQFEPKLRQVVTEVIARDFPYFGACYGLGILADVLGGEVSDRRYSETAGAQTMILTDGGSKDPLLEAIPRSFRAFVGHKEACQEVPPDAELLAESAGCPVQMIRFGRDIYATQFHPELDSKGLALRIETYRDAGYFDPDEAASLTALGHQESVPVPGEILRRFVARYRSGIDSR
ncbi:glutamine amidotransferase [Nocardia sp. NBC_00508]|uniref:glutamine amidotransferase n=1 Tax=Nocardia sp. NBC_00508 TaxID=2975992 RepID=UPI002E80CE09|nr:glutamine amidotransferase [Nocardia sp. NBC_00508]WUD66645.1 glutamine amidotransferase [Nocardia sp. NBC_00508]